MITASYRLQFNKGFTLQNARGVVPYLRRLGVSHIYSSPLLRACPGSTHGYDVADPTRINPELGDEGDLRQFASELEAAGMSLILDIVPNHMAVSCENPYWADILTHGRLSRYANWFDVQWESVRRSSSRVVLPLLADSLRAVLLAGELSLSYKPEEGFRVNYFSHSFPVEPRSLPVLLHTDVTKLRGADPGEEQLVRNYREALQRLRELPRHDDPSGDVEQRAAISSAMNEQIAESYRGSAAVRAHIDRVVEEMRGKDAAARMKRLLALQPYQLEFWRIGPRRGNYRRFFDIPHLVGVRVEDREVFDETHTKILEWVGAKIVNGLRIDHLDGMRDPTAYLETLHEALRDAGAPDCPIFIEKILARGAEYRESLPEQWRVAGTTGYEFAADVEELFHDPSGNEGIEHSYRSLLRTKSDFATAAHKSKKKVLLSLFGTETNRLVRQGLLLSRQSTAIAPLRGADLTRALVEFISGFPVYRSYIAARKPTADPQEREWIERGLEAAARGDRSGAAATAFLRDTLLEERASVASSTERLDFIYRLQQLTSPAAAKGVEDTALYLYAPLLSRNDVGFAPDSPLEGSRERFHTECINRAARYPQSMLALSTHDSKRSSDARLRLAVLTEMHGQWTRLVRQWRYLNEPQRHRAGRRTYPDINMEYHFYQALVAIWPLVGAMPALSEEGDLSALTTRLQEYMVKAAREAKEHTSWTQPDEEYEGALREFVARVLQNPAFVDGVRAFVAQLMFAGMANSIGAVILQTTVPGFPDIYQGSELPAFRLVDPDNRRPVDFGYHAALLDSLLPRLQERHDLIKELAASAGDGRLKLLLLHLSLVTRAASGELFERGSYRPLEIQGDLSERIIAFSRTHGDREAVIIVTRFNVGELKDGAIFPEGHWNNTSLLGLNGGYRNVFTTSTLSATGGPVSVEQALDRLPAAILLRG